MKHLSRNILKASPNWQHHNHSHRFVIFKTAQQLNFETKAIKADMRLFDIADLHHPFIAHVIKDNQLLHYYVVIRTTYHIFQIVKSIILCKILYNVLPVSH